MASLSILLKPASGQCNMACGYCFYQDETRKRARASFGMMSEETLHSVIRKSMLYADRAVSFAFQGGEPTLRGLDFYRRAVSLQRQYRRTGLQVFNALQTNGLALDEDWCRFLAENRFLVGLSVDGTGDTHDLYRRDSLGRGTFDRVRQAAELLDRFGAAYNILTVVTRETAENIREIYRAYHRLGWRWQQYIPCLDPLGEARGGSAWSLRPEQYGRFLCELFSLWCADWQRGSAPSIRQFDNYVGILLGRSPEACDQRGVCGGQWAVEADGSVYPCDFYMLDEYRLGNLNTDRFPQLNVRREEIGFIARSRQLSRECTACRWHPLCRGGCQRHRDPLPGGEAWANYYCQGYQLFFETHFDSLKQIAESVRRRQISLLKKDG